MGRAAERSANDNPKHTTGLDAEIERAMMPLVEAFQASRNQGVWYITHSALRQFVSRIKRSQLVSGGTSLSGGSD